MSERRKPFTKSPREWARFRRVQAKRLSGSASRWFYEGHREMFRLVNGREMTFLDEMKEAFPKDRIRVALAFDRHPFLGIIPKRDSFVGALG